MPTYNVKTNLYDAKFGNKEPGDEVELDDYVAEAFGDSLEKKEEKKPKKEEKTESKTTVKSKKAAPKEPESKTAVE